MIGSDGATTTGRYYCRRHTTMTNLTAAAASLILAIISASAFTTIPLYHAPYQSYPYSLSILFAEKPSGITLKIAVDSQWGVAERAAATSERFTSSASLDMVHRLRRDSDGVLVGKTTVQNDNPSLTVRRVALVANPVETNPKSTSTTTSEDAAEQQPRQQPWRIVLDTHLSLHTPDYTIFNDGLATLVYHAETVDEDTVKNYESDNVICVGVPQLQDGRLSLPAIVKDLQSKRNFSHIMVEGGPTVALAFLNEKLIDRVVLVQALDVTFQDPYPSGMSEETFSQCGLECLGLVESGDGDVLQCWSRPNLPWPTEHLNDWP